MSGSRMIPDMIAFEMLVILGMLIMLFLFDKRPGVFTL